jgi:hypothetical protein
MTGGGEPPGGSEPIPSDGAGSAVFATIEHHFHSEGCETSVAPLLLDADLAARSKRIKFSPSALSSRLTTRCGQRKSSP